MDPTAADPSRIALFDLADRKLAWLGARQGVLSQNVANASTPGWKERDVRPFAEVLAAKLPLDAGALAQTNPLHLRGTAPGVDAGQILHGEQAPDGNAVSLDEQMVKVAQTDNEHELVSTIYSKYLGLFRMALGR
jgi:flagellar basal-body rod protein FlgB